MADETFSAATVAFDPNPDADMSKADFGDVIDPAAAPAAEAVVDPAAAAATPATPAAARDDKGRFVKADTTPAADPAAVDPAAAETAAAEAAAAEAAAVEAAAAEAAAAATATPAAEVADKNVPYHRFKEVVDQRNDLAAKLREAEAARASAVTETKDEIKTLTDARDALYDKVEVLRADGDVKGAAAAQREIDNHNLKIADAQAELRAQQAAFTVTENASYDAMLDQLEATTPAMNPNAPEFDGNLVKEMEFQVAAYEKMGLTSTNALRRAATLLLGADTFAKKPAAAATPAAKPAAAAAAVVDKKPTDIKKNVDAAARTPAQVEHKSDAGDRGGTKSVNDMSEEEFAALPPAVLARLRGDALA